MPIQSQAQWGYLFANDKPFARRWAHETPGGKGKRENLGPARSYVRTATGQNVAQATQQVLGPLVVVGADDDLPRLVGDAGKVATWLGHEGNPTMLHRHYRGLATWAQGEAYFT